jgi:hypothetical protein
MSHFIAIVAVFAFAVGLRLSRMTTIVRAGRDEALAALGALRNAKIPDSEKERIARRTAAAMLACAARLLSQFGAALAPAALISFAGIALGVTSLAHLADVFESWPIVIFASLASLALIGK